MTDMELYLQTNPVFTTAESCLTLISMTGDEDAIKMKDYLGLGLGKNKDTIPKELFERVVKILPVVGATIESRFETHNKFIKASGIKNIVDLPCGFQPRGPRFARKGMNYYGLDLPAVISRVEEAAISVTEEKDQAHLHYCGVDATNYDSLRKALTDVNDEIIITTEGLLSYFNDSELKAVFQNMAKLLTEFGGCWVTFDRTSRTHTMGCLMALLGKEAVGNLSSLTGVSSVLSDFSTGHNILFDEDETAVLAMLDEVGLSLERVPFVQYSADLKILKDYPEGTMDRVNQCVSAVELWVMRAKKQVIAEHSAKVGAADIVCKQIGHSMELSLSGHLDSLNSPDLLAEYEKLTEGKDIKQIVVHMKDLEYISSAGLRTLLILYKKVDGKFAVKDCSPLVHDILEQTGFLDVFMA